MTTAPITVAVLGLGEAGTAISQDLARAGAIVRGFDPAVVAPEWVVACADDADACVGADLVLALTSAHEAEETLTLALPGVGQHAVYADLNTASAGLKQRLAELASGAGLSFADVALMSTVPGRGVHTPMFVSGPGAVSYATTMQAYGARVDVLEGPAGTAATRKLLRSVFYKGMAAAVTEALTAAQAAGCEEWLHANIAAELAAASAATVDELVDGTRLHARRRTDEMAAAAQLLSELGVPARVATASEAWSRQLASERA